MSVSPIELVVRARRGVARPAVRRLWVAVLAVATALTVMSSVQAAGAARDRWGRSHPVAVATRDLAAGEVVDPGAVEVRHLPEGVVPDATLAEVPEGAVVRQPILAGEPVAAARLAPHGLRGAAALVPPDERAVAVPLGPSGAPPLAVGDLVDVLAVLAAGYEPAGDAPAFPLAEQASVVDVAEHAVTVAVPRADAARLAWALAHGTVVLTLAGA